MTETSTGSSAGDTTIHSVSFTVAAAELREAYKAAQHGASTAGAPAGGCSVSAGGIPYNTMRVGIDALHLAAEAPTPYARLLVAMALAMVACDARTQGDGTLWRIKQGLCDAIDAYDRDIRA
jgi:hypothetical protein